MAWHAAWAGRAPRLRQTWPGRFQAASPFSCNVVPGRCYRAVLTQCGPILTQCGPECPDVLSQSGPGEPMFLVPAIYVLGPLHLPSVSWIVGSRLLLLSNRTQSVKPLLSNLYSSTLPIRREKLPRLSVERSRVAEAPRGPEAGRPSRPRRQRGIGAQAKSQLCRPTARHRRALVIGLGRASAGFTVVSAVGTGPPHDGPSRDRPSKVSGAVRDGRRPIGGMASPTSPAGTSRTS